MRPSSFLNFMEKYQGCREGCIGNRIILRFEGCIARSKSEKLCDYAIAVERENKLLLIECKKGRVNVRDFNHAIEQLENSIEIIYEQFEDVPDGAILCYEALDYLISRKLLKCGGKLKLRRNVDFILRKINDVFCTPCL